MVLKFGVEFVEHHAFHLEVVILMFMSVILVLITILVIHVLKHLL